MSNNNDLSQNPRARPHSEPAAGARTARRAPWKQPRLETFGDLRQLTMGLSLPAGESGNPGTRHD